MRELSPAIEPLSLDEAFADLAVPATGLDAERVTEIADQLKADHDAERGLTALGRGRHVEADREDRLRPREADGTIVVPSRDRG